MRTRSTNRYGALFGTGCLGLLLTGCGGDDGDEGTPTPNPSPETIMGATFQISWPERSRSPITTDLSSARSARIVFPKGSTTGTDIEVNVERDANQATAYTGTYTVPVAIRKDIGVFSASFFSDPGETGSTVGLAIGTIDVSAKSLEIGKIIVGGTVRTVSVVAAGPTRVGDAPIQLYVNANDAQGRAVALSSGSILWRIVSGETRATLTSDGSLTPILSGTVSVAATLDGITSPTASVVIRPRLTTPQTQVLPYVANDLAYDPVSNRIWATVPSNADQYPNQVIAIDPASGTVTKAIPIGGDGDHIAITDDGRYAYVTVAADSTARRLDLVAGTLAATIPDEVAGAVDIATLPGLPLSFAVASPPYAENVAVYDGNVRRSGLGAGGLNLQVPDATTIYGEGNGGGSLFTNTLTSTRIRYVNQTDMDTRSLQYSDGLLYTSNGRVIDPANRVVIAQFPTASLLTDRIAAVSSDDDRVYVNTWDSATPKRIVVWDRSARDEVMTYDTGFTPGGSQNLVACGNHTVAFNAFGVDTKSIVIVRNLP